MYTRYRRTTVVPKGYKRNITIGLGLWLAVVILIVIINNTQTTELEVYIPEKKDNDPANFVEMRKISGDLIRSRHKKRDTFHYFRDVCLRLEKRSHEFEILFFHNDSKVLAGIPDRIRCQFIPNKCSIKVVESLDVKAKWVNESSVIVYFGTPNYVQRLIREGPGVFGAHQTFDEVRSAEKVLWWLHGSEEHKEDEKYGRMRWMFSFFRNQMDMISTDLLLEDKNSQLVCFSEVVVGVCSAEVASLCPIQMQQYAAFLRDSYGIKKSIRRNDYLVLRVGQQKIVNEDSLISRIEALVGMSVKKVDFENYSFREQLDIVHNSKGMIGAHGNELAHGIFLQSGSIFLEILPWGFSRELYAKSAKIVSTAEVSQIFSVFRPQLMEVHLEKGESLIDAIIGDSSLHNDSFVEICNKHRVLLNVTENVFFCQWLLLSSSIEVDVEEVASTVAELIALTKRKTKITPNSKEK